MKNLIAIALLLSSFSTYAQFKSGDMVVGGTVSFSTFQPNRPNHNNTSTHFRMSPAFGVFVSQNLELGARLGYSNTSSKIGLSSAEGFGMGLYAQRYFNITDNFLFSIFSGVSYDIENNSYSSIDPDTNIVSESETELNTLRITISPNFVFFPSPRWVFRASIGNIGYRLVNNKTLDDGHKMFNFEYGSVGLSFSYFLKRGNP